MKQTFFCPSPPHSANADPAADSNQVKENEPVSSNDTPQPPADESKKMNSDLGIVETINEFLALIGYSSYRRQHWYFL